MLAPQPSAHRPEQHRDPEEEADGEQYLPEASQVEVLEALVAEPGPKIAREAEDAEPLPDEADDPGQGSMPTLKYHLTSNITLGLSIAQAVRRNAFAKPLEGAYRRQFAR